MLEPWLAGVLDFNGTVGIRLGSRQLQPYIAVYNRRRDHLEQLREVWPDFSIPVFVSRNIYMSQIVSIRGTLKILQSTLPHLNHLHDVAENVIAFCEARLEHPNEKYNIRELQLARGIVEATSRPSSLTRRLEALKKWL